MLASNRSIVKRFIIVITILFVSYSALFLHYLYETKPASHYNVERNILESDTLTNTRNLIVVIADSPTVLESGIKLAIESEQKSTDNFGILISGFGKHMAQDDLSESYKKLSKIYKGKQIVVGYATIYSYKHAMDVQASALIGEYGEIKIFAPYYYIPKVRMLFKSVIGVSIPISLYPLKKPCCMPHLQNFGICGRVKLVMQHYHSYIYLKFRFLLHKYFEFVGFGQKKYVSYAGV